MNSLPEMETAEKVPFCHPERQRRIFKLLKALDSSTAFQNDKQKSVVFQQSPETAGFFIIKKHSMWNHGINRRELVIEGEWYYILYNNKKFQCWFRRSIV